MIMMMNLFSMFDPTTKIWSFNWLSMALIFFFIPAPYISMTSNSSKFTKMMMKTLNSEFKPLSLKTPYALTLIVSIFMMTLACNVVGLTPYTFTASSHLSMTLSLALPAWSGFILLSFSKNIVNTMKHMVPVSTPLILMPFMVMIETVSNMIRPITLSLRLAANMVAGHLILTLISSATANSNNLMFPFMLTSQMAVSLLEMAVAVIQAYVISILITLYLAETN